MSPTFSSYLDRLTDRRALLESKFPAASATGSDATSDAAMAMLWDWLFDALVSANDDEEKNKLGTLAARLYSAVTDRKALELKAREKTQAVENAATPATPTDAETLRSLETKLKLL